ncbi:cell wall anchored protein [Pyrenophora tritici-repentis]|nr:cell wall anchored protein [Pyrenophora tritici-repentis]
MFDFSTGQITSFSGPSYDIGAAEGQLVYIPASDSGLLLYFGGIEHVASNDSILPANMSIIKTYDMASDKWYNQTASGAIPAPRRQFCAGVSSAIDGSSHNIYIYGGHSVDTLIAFNDVYILSLPSFIWIKVQPQDEWLSKPLYGRCTANVVKQDQMLLIDTWYPDASHGESDVLNTLDQRNMVLGNNTVNETIWDSYDPQRSIYAVPSAVITAIGGGPTGGATITAPRSWGHPDLATYFTLSPNLTPRTATRNLPSTQATVDVAPTVTALVIPDETKKNAVIGGTIGAVILTVTVICTALILYHRKKCITQLETIDKGSEVALLPANKHSLTDTIELSRISINKLNLTGDYDVTSATSGNADVARSDQTEDNHMLSTIGNQGFAPQTLKTFSLVFFIGDCILTATAMMFIVLAVAAYKLHQEPLSAHGRMIQSIMTFGPTIYPLLFAALGSRSLKSLAIRLSERGTTIAVLEKLVGSQSFVSAIGTACALRSADILTMLLLLLWALSPLGGQSSLRLLYETNSTIKGSSKVFCSSPMAYFNTPLRVAPAIILASLASSRESRDGSFDPWNHPKIPRLEQIETTASDTTLTDPSWIDIDRTSGDRLTYSSWLGLYIQGLEDLWDSYFQIRYNYITLSCDTHYNGSKLDQPYWTLLDNATKIVPPFPQNQSLLWTTTIDSNGEKASFSSPDFLRYSVTTGEDLPSFTSSPRDWQATTSNIFFLYGVSSSTIRDPLEPSHLVVYKCLPRLITVEAKIICQSDACRVDKMRRVRNDAGPKNGNKCKLFGENWLACLTADTAILAYFVTMVPAMSTPFALQGGKSRVQDYIFTEGAGSEIFQGAGSEPNQKATDQPYEWGTVPVELISQRLSILLNSY